MPTPTTWNTFSLQAAMQGVRVGFQNSTNVFDDTATGVLDKWQSKELTSDGEVVQYRVIIKDITVYCNESGVPYDTTGVAAAFPGYTTSALKLYQPEGASTRDTGAKNVTRAIIGGEDLDGNAVISSLEPRDYYAMHILAHMLKNIAKPDQSDVGNITYFCSAAYRWAQGMMNAAAAARTNIPVAQDEVNMRGASTLDQLVEKLTEAIEGGGGGGGTDPNAVHYDSQGNVSISDGDGNLDALQLSADYLVLWDQGSGYTPHEMAQYLTVEDDVLLFNGSPVGGGGWTPTGASGTKVATADIVDGAITNAKIYDNTIQKGKLHEDVGDVYVNENSVTGLLSALRNYGVPVTGKANTSTHTFLFWAPKAYVESGSGMGSGTVYFYYKGQFSTREGTITNPILVAVNNVVSLCVSSGYAWEYDEATGPKSPTQIYETTDIQAIENAAAQRISHAQISGTTTSVTINNLNITVFVVSPS